MNKVLYIISLIVAAVATITSCSSTMTYAEQRDRENSAIASYVKKNNIKVISESEFNAQGNTTDVSKNEYVLFSSTGVYMQIISKGKGKGGMLKSGESATVLCRYKEYNINGDSVQSFNDGLNTLSVEVDKMTVKNTSGTFSATFTDGVMKTIYSSTTVPTGWLVPLSYINLVRPNAEDSEDAQVKLILPHDQGHTNAQTNVYACEFTIYYRLGN